MKKLFAIVLSLCLLCAVALAEENVTELNWEDFQEAAAQIEGDFYQVGDLPLRMFIPAIFSEMEVTEEQQAQGVLAILSVPDDSARVAVSRFELGDMDLDTYEQELIKEGAEELAIVSVNGLPAVNYDLTMNDVKTTNLAFITDDNAILTFSFGPMSDEGFAAVAMVMVASIQAIQ